MKWSWVLGAGLAGVPAAGDGRPPGQPDPKPQPGRKGDKPGEVVTPPDRGEKRVDGTLKVGDPAPDFTLKTVDGKGEVTLSAFRGKRPVVLIFGSYT